MNAEAPTIIEEKCLKPEGLIKKYAKGRFLGKVP
jgi:hypothetical protein